MAEHTQEVPSQSVTSPKGFLAGATFAGMKTYTDDKLDLALLVSEFPATAAGMFTTNRIKSPSVVLSKEHLRAGKIRAIFANSGIANAGVGAQGYADAKECTRVTAEHLGISPQEVVVLSTGIIGVELSMALVRAAIQKIIPTRNGGHDLARAIMTTDTYPKECATSFAMGKDIVTIGGVSKGSGMIHPNMATTLTILTTDAAAEPVFLKNALKKAVDATLNMVTVDGETSTNDSVILIANGAAVAQPIVEGTVEATAFQENLTNVCTQLARQIARDGEGATKLLTVTLQGAQSLKDARMGARSIARSSLVKTAVYGNDPNWGRILSSLGASGAMLKEDKVAMYINDVCVMEHGTPIPFFKDAIIGTMQEPEVTVRIDLHLGSAQATAWGCDLTQDYVTLNAAYTT